MEFTFRNVNDAFYSLVWWLGSNPPQAAKSPSRVGDIIRIEEPVRVTYTHPWERVLFNPTRDCNPFFHLYEALWMLAGRNDVESVAYYNPRMREFSDNGETFHGAYGYRWRNWFGYDQLAVIIKELREDPMSRRCVLQMWDASACGVDDEHGRHDLHMATHGGKDVPCNLCACFVIRDSPSGSMLEMTVFNRSNDIIWGMLGANVVHFSILQQYMANRIGVAMGRYHQVTNDMHVYTERWEPEKWLEEEWSKNYYPDSVYEPMPIVHHTDDFEEECPEFVDRHSKDSVAGNYSEPFLAKVAQPMCVAFHRHKRREYNRALQTIEAVEAPDWRKAGREWLQRRKAKWEAKQ